MDSEKRKYSRFEPPLLNALVETQTQHNFRGWVLDVSQGGMAIDLPENTDVPEVGSTVSIQVKNGNSTEECLKLGTAKVRRTWRESIYFDNGKGVALEFDQEIAVNGQNRFLLQGTRQKTRVASQVRLAALDIDHLSAYRRSLGECQVKFYTNMIMLSVSLAAAYFALNYYGIATGTLSRAETSFWRTLVAASPGIIAATFAVMISKKNASIQQVDAYLGLLKECLVRNHYPREYRGWETESRKFRHIMKTTRCDHCFIERKCGKLSPKHGSATDGPDLLWNPGIDLYYTTMYMTFLTILAVSITAVVVELLRFQLGTGYYMMVSAAVTLILGVAVVAIPVLSYHLRKGKYSFDYNKRCWEDLLGRCRESI